MVRDLTIRHTGSDPIDGDFRGKDIISLSQFCPRSLDRLFAVTARMRAIAVNSRPSDILEGIIVTLLFYEPSSRTSGSFDAAIKQLGGQTTVPVNPQQFSSVAKGEDLADTIRTFESYSDAIVLRHPDDDAAKLAADAAENVPLINAGSGKREHPTQALLDLFTIFEQHGRLSGLKGLFVGDIRNGRTVHSALEGLALYESNEVYLLSPESLALDGDHFDRLVTRGLKLHNIHSSRDIPWDCDFVYWTRVQRERMNDKEYQKVKDALICDPELMTRFTNPGMILMHPLPRVSEIDRRVDRDSRAVYLRTQIRNGMYVRMALAALVFDQVPVEWEIK